MFFCHWRPFNFFPWGLNELQELLQKSYMLAPNLYQFCSQMYPKCTEQLLAHKSCLTNICWINESSKSHGIGIIIILLLQKKKMRHTGVRDFPRVLIWPWYQITMGFIPSPLSQGTLTFINPVPQNCLHFIIFSISFIEHCPVQHWARCFANSLTFNPYYTPMG